MSKQIANLYIDGFNVYHKIDKYYWKTNKQYCYKWLNYRSLFNSLLKSNESIGKIYFFTALSEEFFAKDKIKRHGIYIDALQTEEIEIIKGNFKANTDWYKISKQCTLKIKVPNEKETDIRIAIQMIKDAYLTPKDELHKLFLMSGDTDFTPVLEDINKNTNRLAGLITPPHHKGIVPLGNIDSLKNKCRSYMVIKLRFDQLNGHSFEEEILSTDGKTIIRMPEEYSTF